MQDPGSGTPDGGLPQEEPSAQQWAPQPDAFSEEETYEQTYSEPAYGEAPAGETQADQPYAERCVRAGAGRAALRRACVRAGADRAALRRACLPRGGRRGAPRPRPPRVPPHTVDDRPGHPLDGPDHHRGRHPVARRYHLRDDVGSARASAHASDLGRARPDGALRPGPDGSEQHRDLREVHRHAHRRRRALPGAAGAGRRAQDRQEGPVIPVRPAGAPAPGAAGLPGHDRGGKTALAEVDKETRAKEKANVAAQRRPDAGIVVPTSYTDAALAEANAFVATKDFKDAIMPSTST